MEIINILKYFYNKYMYLKCIMSLSKNVEICGKDSMSRYSIDRY